MSKRTDAPRKGAILYDITAISNLDTSQGAGDIQLLGTLYTDTIGANTIGGSITIPDRLLFTNTTTATNQTSGGAVFSGGVGIAGNVYAANVFSNGTQLINSSAGTNISVTSGVVSVVNAPTFTGVVTVTNSTASTSVSTGSIVNSGGIGTGSMSTSIINIADSVSVPAAPTANYESIFMDSSDSKVKSVSDAGMITVYAPQTTKGDLSVYDGTASRNVRFPVGANGTVLSSNSSTSSGLIWTSIGTSSTLSQMTDAYINYLSANDTLGGSTITSGGTYLDITYTGVSRNDPGYTINGANITFNTTGNFIVYWNINVTATNFAQFMSRIMTGPNTSSYTEYAGSRSFGYVDGSNVTSGGLTKPSQTICGSVFLNVAAIGTALKLQVTETPTTTNVGTLLAYSGITIHQIVIASPALDNSRFFESYDAAGALTLTTTYQTLVFTTNRVNTSAGFTYSAGTVTVNRTGYYLLLSRITCSNTQAAGRNTTNSTLVNLQLLVNGVASTQNNGFVYTPTDNVATSNTGFLCTFLNLTSGNTVAIQARLTAANATTRTVANASNFMLINYSNTSTGQTNCSFFDEYTSASTTLNNTTFTDVVFTSPARVNTGSTITQTSTTVLTFNSTGTYIVVPKYTFTGSTAQLAAGGQVVVQYTGQATYSALQGTQVYVTGLNNNTANSATVCNPVALFVTAGSSIKLQGKGYNQNTPYSTVAASSSLIVYEIETTLMPTTPAVVYGAFYQCFQSLGLSSTTSTTLQTKYTTVTANIGAGTYIVHGYYEIYTNGGNMLTVISVDNTPVHQSNEFVTLSGTLNGVTPSSPKSFLYYLPLTAGLHTVTVQWCTSSVLRAAFIQNVYVQLYQVQ